MKDLQENLTETTFDDEEDLSLVESYNDEDVQQDDTDNEVQDNKFSIKSILIDLLVYSIILFVSLKIVPLYVVQRTIVDGPSMMETLQDGESLIVEKISYRFTDIKRFDIVIFFPYGPEIDEYYVKRIIALPNETIQIIDDNIYIDGKLEEENFGKDPIEFQGIAEEPITLGEDEYFVMGDNRNLSLDSRYESLGPINKKNIVGKAVLRIWPLKDFKVLK